MSSEKSCVVDASGVGLRVRIVGSGFPIVLLHGVTANAAIWEPVVDGLATWCRAIAIDQRGHGASGKPEFGYSGADYASDVVQVIEALDCRGAVVVGHSLGARNALVVGSRFSELIRGVIAIEFTPFIDPVTLDGLWDRVTGGERRFESESDLRKYLTGRYPRLPVEAINRRMESGYQLCGGDAWEAKASSVAMRQTVTGLREDLVPTVASVRVPTMVVRGADSALVSAEAVERTRALRPDFAFSIVDGADHYVPEERPERVLEEVERFVASLK